MTDRQQLGPVGHSLDIASQDHACRRLWAAVIETAVTDALTGRESERKPALHFLMSPYMLEVADMAGMSGEWVRRKLTDGDYSSEDMAIRARQFRARKRAKYEYNKEKRGG